MDTKEIKTFYNDHLQESKNQYEHDRWRSSPQAKASFVATQKVVKKVASFLPATQIEVFELGPGPGTWTKELLKKSPESKFTLVDISDEMLKQAKESLSEYQNITYIASDILDFSSEKKYDFFFSSRMIEYVPDKKEALRRIVDALAPNAKGCIITKTPQYDRPFSKKIVSRVHQHQIKASELATLLEELGCQVVSIESVTSVFPGVRSGLLDRWLSAICQKLPFTFCRLVSESYAITFKKNN